MAVTPFGARMAAGDLSTTRTRSVPPGQRRIAGDTRLAVASS